MNKKERLQETVKDLQTALTKAQRELAEAEVTYSIGDRFKHKKTGEKRILIAVAGCSDGCNTMIARLADGHGTGFEANDWGRITPKEIDAFFHLDNFTRYWDARKKVLV